MRPSGENTDAPSEKRSKMQKAEDPSRSVGNPDLVCPGVSASRIVALNGFAVRGKVNIRKESRSADDRGDYHRG